MTGTALKIAVRDLRASWSKFFLVVLAVAAGVGALTGVRGFSESFRTMLRGEARSLMAADLFVRIFSELSEGQKTALQSLAGKGVVVTRVTETLSMVASSQVPAPALVTLKAVDPAVYPLYGEVKLDPPTPLRQALRDDTVLISDDLKIRLRVSAGDGITVGGKRFGVAGILITEPDRMSGSFSVGPRLMMTRAGLERTGLVGPGSRASQRVLFRLNQTGMDLQTAEEQLKRAFPEALVVNYRDLNPNVSLGLQRATTFLSLVSLIALIIGAIGVGTSIHAHLQTRLDSVAVIKSIGGRSGQIIRIYLLQTVLLGLTGGVLGVVAGFLIQRAFPLLLGRFLPITPEAVFSVAGALQGLALGLLTTVLFTVPPLLSIREVRPALILRRDMEEVQQSLSTRLRKNGRTIAAGLVICAGLAGLAGSLVSGTPFEAAKIAGTFVGGLAISLLVLAGTATVLIRALRWFSGNSAMLPVSLRHAIGNLHRPGSQSRAVLSALGVGVMFTITVYLVQRSVLDEIRRSAPPGMSNVFFIDVTEQQRDALASLVRRYPGVQHAPEIIGTVSCKLTAINGVPIDQIPSTGGLRRYRMARTISSEARKPDGVTVLRGAWWNNPSLPQISVGAGAARILRVEPGSTLTWDAFGKTIETRVAAVHRTEEQRLRGMLEFYASPGSLEGFPTVYYAAARVKGSQIGELQRLIYQRFPTVTVINVADILERVQQVVDQIAVVIRFLSGFAIFAGAIILASSVAGTRFRRVREMAVFKTLGATRHRIAAMFSVEFLILGTTAGLMGSLMGTAFTWLVLKRFFNEVPFRFDAMAVSITVLMTALIASAAGWLAIFPILRLKPLEVLRGE